MVLRLIYSVVLLCLLLLSCDHGDAVKDLKEKHSTTTFQKNCDEAEEKTCYEVDEDEGKSSFSSSFIARLESKYKPGYGYAVDEVEQKSSSPSSYIKRLESKYKPGYEVDEHEGKSSFPSSYIARLESKYKPGYAVDEVEQKSSSPSAYIARLESKYKSGYVVDDIEEKSSSPSAYIARLERKYKPGYGVDETEEKSSSPSAYIARLESKYQPDYGVTEAEKKSSSPSSYIARLESKYQPDYGVTEAEKKSSSPSSYIARLESKYKSGYVVDEDEEKSFPSSSKIKNNFDNVNVVPHFHKDVNGIEENKSPQPSSKAMEHHIMENHGDDDIGSEDVGVFTIDDVRAFNVGRKLSTFFSIRNHSLYPGFLPREVADSIPFSSSEILKILQFFSVSPDSPKGKAVKDTLRRCEFEPAKGETKICVASSESMLEFLRNAFGPEADFKLISTTHPTMATSILQSYTVLEPAREIESPKKVACHPFPYLYTIYMCHFDATETKVFNVPLVGDNGDKVDALILCHMDTSAWSPKHVAFSLLGTKPGIPVCHAFTEGHGVWIQSSPIAAI